MQFDPNATSPVVLNHYQLTRTADADFTKRAHGEDREHRANREMSSQYGMALWYAWGREDSGCDLGGKDAMHFARVWAYRKLRWNLEEEGGWFPNLRDAFEHWVAGRDIKSGHIPRTVAA